MKVNQIISTYAKLNSHSTAFKVLLLFCVLLVFFIFLSHYFNLSMFLLLALYIVLFITAVATRKTYNNALLKIHFLENEIHFEHRNGKIKKVKHHKVSFYDHRKSGKKLLNIGYFASISPIIQTYYLIHDNWQNLDGLISDFKNANIKDESNTPKIVQDGAIGDMLEGFD